MVKKTDGNFGYNKSFHSFVPLKQDHGSEGTHIDESR